MIEFQILLHNAESKKPIILMGHSLGGILSRLIALNLLDSGRISRKEDVKIIMFDSWVLRTEKLKLDVLENYLRVKNIYFE